MGHGPVCVGVVYAFRGGEQYGDYAKVEEKCSGEVVDGRRALLWGAYWVCAWGVPDGGVGGGGDSEDLEKSMNVRLYTDRFNCAF